MTESDYLNLRELASRRPLTREERAGLDSYLLIHPEAQQDWEEEMALNQALLTLPNCPISSNFTARVLQAVELDELQKDRLRERTPRLGWLRRLLPRVAVAALVLGLGGLGYQRVRLHELEQRAETVQMVTKVASTLPDVQMWQDFDAIARLAQPVSPAQDEILWAALKD